MLGGHDDDFKSGTNMVMATAAPSPPGSETTNHILILFILHHDQDSQGLLVTLT